MHSSTYRDPSAKDHSRDRRNTHLTRIYFHEVLRVHCHENVGMFGIFESPMCYGLDGCTQSYLSFHPPSPQCTLRRSNPFPNPSEARNPSTVRKEKPTLPIPCILYRIYRRRTCNPSSLQSSVSECLHFDPSSKWVNGDSLSQIVKQTIQSTFSFLRKPSPPAINSLHIRPQLFGYHEELFSITILHVKTEKQLQECDSKRAIHLSPPLPPSPRSERTPFPSPPSSRPRCQESDTQTH